ncbi:Oidioi.mRNA.OKI2018_I69.PAR.g9902.t1.cds [Oikopleura dioica]|uniref:Oidioi.mRNA.OKI2018_I69.PAR.g9902.t1.cds n=1 Tax=Oikopleura dioica TaxID=34765 RepID=A0ABN7RMU4_OIKDI|nr:Oidioi.mRNA.OKI2018_I69.PAR.g9902.t1.cds [Oikopleura dioica]
MESPDDVPLIDQPKEKGLLDFNEGYWKWFFMPSSIAEQKIYKFQGRPELAKRYLFSLRIPLAVSFIFMGVRFWNSYIDENGVSPDEYGLLVLCIFVVTLKILIWYRCLLARARARFDIDRGQNDWCLSCMTNFFCHECSKGQMGAYYEQVV